MDPENAERSLVWAVETALKEQRRREEEGVKEDEGSWMDDEESGAAMESLADNYSSQQKHYLSAPLYLQSLSLLPPKSCHAVILMSNLSLALFLQNPPPAPHTPNPSLTQHLTSARTWAQKALSLASAIQPPSRTEECDRGCAVAMAHLAKFAELEGNINEAKGLLEKSAETSRRVGWREGEREAEVRLKSLGRGT
ncbi:hypothetical protein MMC14_008459 [Varicellaria rhodocarpa]|nr:hypothetical protein [Varicellaria rhodocarpa]